MPDTHFRARCIEHTDTHGSLSDIVWRIQVDCGTGTRKRLGDQSYVKEQGRHQVLHRRGFGKD